MHPTTSLVITSIQGSEHKVLKEYALRCAENNIGFIVAGDTKSPQPFELPGCDYLSLEDQLALPFKLPKLLPHKNYAKKNCAYLQAIKNGSTVIIETDDDNLPFEDFWNVRKPEVTGQLAGNGSWVNAYRYFSETFIWPRGFSLKHLKDPPAELKTQNPAAFFSPVQQALVDENPDVDAIYRLSLPLPFNFEKRGAVVLGSGSVCPFNSQNTTWFRPAFPLLYLPSHCSFRMCDIWRSFIAQRILWTNGWHLSFHASSAYQQRNEHDLIKDFEDEVSGYLHNHTIVDALRALDLEPGEANLCDNLRACYTLLTAKNYIGKEELPLLEAWIEDIQTLMQV